jgi:hypothetical protein
MATTRRNNSDEKEIQAIPCARSGNQKEAQLLKRFGVDGPEMGIFGEWIAQRDFVIHEEAEGFGF